MGRCLRVRQLVAAQVTGLIVGAYVFGMLAAAFVGVAAGDAVKGVWMRYRNKLFPDKWE